MAYEILLSSTATPLVFGPLIQSSDHITGLTGASPTVTISKNGGNFTTPGGAVSEIGSGWYKVAGNATDTGTLGPIALHATAASADPFDQLIAQIVAYDPTNAVNSGLSALPNAAAGAAGGIVVNGSNSGNITIGTLTTGAATLASLTCTGELLVSAGVVFNQSTPNGSGLTVNGNGNGPGVSINAGGSGNASGAVFSGTGTGHGISSAGGTTGNGLQLAGGSSSGDGIHILTTSGIGLHISATGGVSISAPTITANITGNITGGFSVTSPANVLQINGNSTAASNLGITTNDILRGTVTTGASTTSIPTSAFIGAGVGEANQFVGRGIMFDSNTTTTGLQGTTSTITVVSNSATPTFTVLPALPAAPASGDTFSVI